MGGMGSQLTKTRGGGGGEEERLDVVGEEKR